MTATDIHWASTAADLSLLADRAGMTGTERAILDRAVAIVDARDATIHELEVEMATIRTMENRK